LFLQSTPDEALLKAIRQQLQELQCVNSIHYLHLWSLDGEHHVLTVHLVVNDGMNILAHIKLKQDVALLLSEHKYGPYDDRA
jgi:cobalt-zinc-cadmium efflux system protein